MFADKGDHRAQGATVDVAHVLDDCGGRELAYVAMSRSRLASHFYVTAPDLSEPSQRLAWSWDDERRQQWVTDPTSAAEHLEALRADLTDLRTGTGRWAETSVRAGYKDLQRARWVHDQNLRRARNRQEGILARRRNRPNLDTSAAVLVEADNICRQLTQPHTDHLTREQSRLTGKARELEAAQL